MQNPALSLEYFSQDYAFEYLYPFPLADLYRRYRFSRTATDRLGYLLACAEASLKFMTAVTVSVVYDDPRTKSILRAGERYWKAPGFGTWLHILEDVAPILPQSQKSAFHSKLASCVASGGGVFRSAIQTLVARRNEYVHAGAITDAAAEIALDDILPTFHAAFQELMFLARCHFIVCEEIRRIRRPPCFEAIIRNCRGSNPVFPFEVWRLDNAIDPLIPLLAVPDLEVAFSLHPVVAALHEDPSSSLRFYFYHKQSSKTLWHTYHPLSERTIIGTAEFAEDVSQWIQGAATPTRYDIEFLEKKKPSWLLSLDSFPSAPKGYQIVGKIGEGRFAQVYKVLHTGMNQVRALKALRPEATRDPKTRKRFEVEAQAIAKLKSKGVTPELYEYGETTDGIPYLIMDFAENGSIEDALTTWGPKPWKEVLDIAIHCYRSLNIIHGAGIIHRDIKLSNILLLDGNLVFCDFGVGRIAEPLVNLTAAGDIVGTMAYMPPEQRAGNADARSDLFALGVTMVFLLVGSVVSDPRQWLYQQFTGSSEFRNALLSVLEAIPENRPPSAIALAERLLALRQRINSDAESSLTSNLAEPIVQGALLPIPRERSPLLRNWTSPDGTVFREIPAGEFLMGGTKFADERPIHRVRVSKQFFLAATLVTNAQFSEFCRKTKHRGMHHNFLLHLRRSTFEPQWKEPSAPVVFITWSDAKQYALWSSERDDLDYRIPTEAEWEYACRAETQTVYPWGNTIENGKLNANNKHGYPTPVGTYPPNLWGLFDMLGNVWEWCEDVMDVTTHEESLFYRKCANVFGGTAVDPVNTGPDSMSSQRVPRGTRVGRGGSFFSEAYNYRPANRRGQPYSEPSRAFGFRLALHNLPESRLS